MYWINPNAEVGPGCVAFMADTTADIAHLPTSSKYGVKQGEDDISYLPCQKSSTCMTLNPSGYYVLNSQDQWIKL